MSSTGSGPGRTASQADRVIGLAVVLLVLKVGQSALLVGRAEGADLDFVPEVSTGEAVRTVALWLIAAALVNYRHIAGWAMAVTIAAVSIATSATAEGEVAWTWVSLVGSVALTVVLLSPPVARFFVGRYLPRSRREQQQGMTTMAPRHGPDEHKTGRRP